MKMLKKQLNTLLEQFKPGPSANGQAALEARQITFAFNGAPVLRHVDLRLEAGKMVGVIGPNGAGKSTLVKLLSRLLIPANGQIWLNGHNLADWSPSKLARVMAVVPQDPQLPLAYSAWEIVLMGRTPYLGWMGQECEQDRAIAQRAMQETNTWHLAHRLIGQLSGGEQQRVVIARALAQEPQVLLLDEPTAHLDINFQVETLSLITRLVKELQLAALAIFHDLNLAAQYCDDLVLLNRGEVVVQGSPEQVLKPPTLQQVYGTRVAVIAHPRNGLPVVIPT
jgi:iron complex transport system ATP-binding protein